MSKEWSLCLHKNLYVNALSSMIHKKQRKCLSINSWMDTQDGVHPYRERYMTVKRREAPSLATWIKLEIMMLSWEKPDTKATQCVIPFMGEVQKGTSGEIGSRLVVARSSDNSWGQDFFLEWWRWSKTDYGDSCTHVMNILKAIELYTSKMGELYGMWTMSQKKLFKKEKCFRQTLED